MKNPRLPFAENDPVVFYDRKERMYYDVLKSGKQTNIRGDLLPHDQIIGRTEGFMVSSQREIRFWVFRPTLNEHVVLMPRGATVIYPKDLGVILQYADIYPGAKVVEAGLGSGALATTLLRMVGPEGSVTSYEIRRDFIENAKKNMRLYLGEAPNHHVREVNIYERFEDDAVDRLFHLLFCRSRHSSNLCAAADAFPPLPRWKPCCAAGTSRICRCVRNCA
jgi:tRNA (adenine57-N1/adenine58-N1)-methyltransferase